MNDQRGLILMMYAGFAGVVLVSGFVYKEVRDYRERKKRPEFKFPAPNNDAKSEAPGDHFAAAGQR